MDYSFYSICYPDYLMHYGVKGMKWGHRKARSQAYIDASNRAQAAKAAYKQAKIDTRAAAKAERNTPEAKAARKAKAAKAAKIGAAVAGTALAAYGAYKLNDYVKTKHAQIQADRGWEYAEEKYREAKKRAMSAPLEPGTLKETVTMYSNSGYKALDAARDAYDDSFRTAAKNVMDYRKQNGRHSLNGLRSFDMYKWHPEGSNVTFEKRR